MSHRKPVPHAMRRLPRAALATLMLSFALPAAAETEISGGVALPIRGKPAPIVGVAWLPELRTFDSAVLRLDLGLVVVGPRDTPKNRSLDDTVAVGLVGVRYERTDSGFFAGFAVGAQAGETDALSGGPQFASTLGWRWDRWSLAYRHISNAGIEEPNFGEDTLLVGYRF